MIIAIDGPAGSGKTTIARLLAQRLGIFYLDTGATYRMLTYAVLEQKADSSNPKVLSQLAQSLNITIKDGVLYLDGVNLSHKIRTPEIDRNISLIVSFPQVRKVMVDLQRRLAAKEDCVVEGRDTTTVVFPQAEFKFYLDANPETRAKRRYQELAGKGVDISFNEVKADLEKRDSADKSRKTGPLVLSKDAVYIDTSDLNIAESVEKIAKYVGTHP